MKYGEVELVGTYPPTSPSFSQSYLAASYSPDFPSGSDAAASVHHHHSAGSAKALALALAAVFGRGTGGS